MTSERSLRCPRLQNTREGVGLSCTFQTSFIVFRSQRIRISGRIFRRRPSSHFASVALLHIDQIIVDATPELFKIEVKRKENDGFSSVFYEFMMDFRINNVTLESNSN